MLTSDIACELIPDLDEKSFEPSVSDSDLDPPLELKINLLLLGW